MKILNAVLDEIPACTSFEYRGFVLSFSTIFKPANMRVFKGNQDVTHLFCPAFKPHQVKESGLAPSVESILFVTRAIDSLYLTMEVTGEDPFETNNSISLR